MPVFTSMRVTYRICACLLIASAVRAETAVRIDPATGGIGWLTRPYKARSVPAINLTNSSRLETLIRAGNLYLSAQDVVALALENNIDIEVQRYGPLLAREILRRAEGGGILRSVGRWAWRKGRKASACTGVSVNGNGTSLSAGGNGVSSGGGIVTQLGPAIPSLDPTFHCFRAVPARHQSAEQHRLDRDNGALCKTRAHTRRSTRKTGYSA